MLPLSSSVSYTEAVFETETPDTGTVAGTETEIETGNNELFDESFSSSTETAAETVADTGDAQSFQETMTYGIGFIAGLIILSLFTRRLFA